MRPVGELAEASAGRIGLVDDTDAIAVDESGTIEMSADGERCAHVRSPCCEWIGPRR